VAWPQGGLQHHTEEVLERGGELDGDSIPCCRPVSFENLPCPHASAMVWCAIVLNSPCSGGWVVGMEERRVAGLSGVVLNHLFIAQTQNYI